MSKATASTPAENLVFKPAPEFSKKARIGSMAEYKRLHAESIKTPAKFWGREASELKWLDIKGVFEYDERDKTAMAAALKEFFERDAIVITKKTKRGMGESDIRPAIKTTSKAQANPPAKAVLAGNNPAARCHRSAQGIRTARRD